MILLCKNTDLDNGYFVKGSVWSFDIRYEYDTNSKEYLFKMFIESADTNHSGTFKTIIGLNKVCKILLLDDIVIATK